MSSKQYLVGLGLVIFLAACQPPQLAYDRFTSVGDPARFIDNSLEHVTIPLDLAQGLDDLDIWLKESMPQKAILQCIKGDILCTSARRTLNDHNVPVTDEPSLSSNQIVLVYDRLSFHDCDQRFVEILANPYNLNHPAFGCSVTSNTLRMVSDKGQITNPATLGPLDGTEAATIVDDYRFGESIFEGEDGSLLDDVTVSE